MRKQKEKKGILEARKKAIVADSPDAIVTLATVEHTVENVEIKLSHLSDPIEAETQFAARVYPLLSVPS